MLFADDFVRNSSRGRTGKTESCAREHQVENREPYMRVDGMEMMSIDE